MNLLQPQERRSARPGDSADARLARRRFRAAGYEAPIVDAVIAVTALAPSDAALEVGCGEGDYLAAVAARHGCEGHGLDISADAIDAAARRYPRLHWIVANADRVLPYPDRSFHLVLSVTGRRNPVEVRRVIRADGRLLVVVSGADDLIELRTAALGRGMARERLEATLAAFAPLFALERHLPVRHVVRLDASGARDAMAGSYRGFRAGERARLAGVESLDVTLDRDVLLLAPTTARWCRSTRR